MKNISTSLTNSRKKWLLSIAAALVFIILLFPFALEYYLQRKLPDIINTKTPYRVTIADFKLSLINGNISISKLDISTKKTKDNVTQIQGTANKIVISDFGIVNALFRKSYTADKILVADSNIKIKLTADSKNKKKEKKALDFNIKTVAVNNVNAEILNAGGRPVFKGNSINVHLENIKQNNGGAKIPVAFSKINLNASDVKISVNEFYEIEASHIITDNKVLLLQSFRLTHLLEIEKYNAKNVFDFASEVFTARDFAVSQDSLIVSGVSFVKPYLKVMSTGKNKVENNQKRKDVEMKIGMKSISFKDGSIEVFQSNKEKTASVDHFNFTLNDIVFDKNTVKEKIPFRFTHHDIEAENIYFKSSPLQAFKIAKISSRNSDITINDFKMLSLGKSTVQDVYSVSAKHLNIFRNKSRYIGQKLNINIGGIEVDRPEIQVYSASGKKQINKKKNTLPAFSALVGYININGGKIQQSVQGREKIALEKFEIKLKRLQTDQTQLRNPIPFTVDNHFVKAENMNMDAGKYYRLKLGTLINSGTKTEIADLQYLPKYSRKAFSKVIDKETDLYTIKAKKISIQDHHSSFGKNGSIDLKNIAVDGLNCNIYHDLAPPDDHAVRYLFSKKLRDIKMPLFINDISIKNSELTYEENAENSNIPGKITFNKFNARVANVNNAKIKGRPTVITTDARFDFFGNADTQVNWKFDVQDTSDRFTINGNIQKLSAENVNLFVRPYLNVTLDGQIDYLKFDYHGNSGGIAGNFYFKYKDMYVNLLNKKGKERKFLTTVANWFVKDESTGEPDHVVIEKKREPERSFFNMLWQGIMEGLKKYVI